MKKLIKRIFSLIILLIMIVGVYVLFAISPVIFFDYEISENDTFKIIGHRGASEIGPENTISSIEKVLELDIDRVEIDVHQSKDNQVVLMHDVTLERTTDGNGLVKDYSYNELLKLDAGSHFNEFFKGEQIPLLDNVLKLINGKKKLIIEVKKGNGYYPNIEKNIVDLIKKNNAADWVIIHTFNTDVITEFHKLAPDIPLHKLFIGNLPFTNYIYSDHLEYFDFEKYDYISEYSLNYHFATSKMIDFLHSKGKKVNTWTVNDHQTITDLIHLGIDGIITDNPTYAYF